jgi:hypothetical protein
MFGRKEEKEYIAKWEVKICNVRTQRPEGMHRKVEGRNW